MTKKRGELTVRGQAPKKPEKNLHMRMVWRSFPVATPRLKIENPKLARTRGSRRPFSSDNGAQMIGPVANLRSGDAKSVDVLEFST
jgi:hypothetical protein